MEDDALAVTLDDEDGEDEGDWQEHAPSEHDSDDSDEGDSDEDPDSDDDEVVVPTRKRRRLVRSSGSVKLKIEPDSDNFSDRYSITSFPIPRPASDALYPSRGSGSNPTQNLAGRLSTPRSLVLRSLRLIALCRLEDPKKRRLVRGCASVKKPKIESDSDRKIPNFESLKAMAPCWFEEILESRSERKSRSSTSLIERRIICDCCTLFYIS